jgi:hypothetical protein
MASLMTSEPPNNTPHSDARRASHFYCALQARAVGADVMPHTANAANLRQVRVSDMLNE